VQIEVPKGSKDAFVVSAPSFEQCVMNWVVETYQPLRCVKDKSFCEMCYSLNKKAHILSRDKL
jgi:hypothetical protein